MKKNVFFFHFQDDFRLFCCPPRKSLYLTEFNTCTFSISEDLNLDHDDEEKRKEIFIAKHGGSKRREPPKTIINIEQHKRTSQNYIINVNASCEIFLPSIIIFDLYFATTKRCCFDSLSFLDDEKSRFYIFTMFIDCLAVSSQLLQL